MPTSGPGHILRLSQSSLLTYVQGVKEKSCFFLSNRYSAISPSSALGCYWSSLRKPTSQGERLYSVCTVCSELDWLQIRLGKKHNFSETPCKGSISLDFIFYLLEVQLSYDPPVPVRLLVGWGVRRPIGTLV